MSEAPSCVKCGGAHWRFVKCEDAGERAVAEKAAAAGRALKVVRPEWRTDRDREVRTMVGRDPLKVYPEWRTTTNDGPKAA